MREEETGESSGQDVSRPLHDEILNRLARGDSLDEIIEAVVLKSPRVANHIAYRAHLIAGELNGESVEQCKAQLLTFLWERLRRKDYTRNAFCLDKILRQEITWAAIEMIRNFVGRNPKSRRITIKPAGDIEDIAEEALSHQPYSVFEFDDFRDCVRRQIETFPRPIARILTLYLLHEECVTAIARKVHRTKSRISQIINKNIAVLRDLIAKRCLGVADA